MSTQFTKDNLNDIVVESVVDTLNFNNQQAILTVRGGAGELDQTYFERYSNNKVHILKSAGVLESSIPSSINVENVLIAKQIADLIAWNPELKEIKNHYAKGNVKIDTTTPLTTLKLIGDDLIKNASSDILLRISTIQRQPIRKGFEVSLPAFHPDGFVVSNLMEGLKVAGEYVTQLLVEIKNKVDLKADDKQVSKNKPKI
ncbi:MULTISPECIES: hypothetical protein [Pseudomonas fluorescens group]|jgi:hypothetical protein|uniref:Phage protein n=4 Tax=Pseudomonas fluorescens group TaxID=136843 RepID=A0ABS0URH7_9PSED|nr:MULTISPECIES: hypothetical protein [Pseudomonas fluorescens group]KWV71479.1 hypothetical protein PFL603g_04930 [Pseudomonas fluorescens]MBI6568182.1 hypothetical protein [Pseudomonas synxantha]MBI6647381.1 hypothetical protein [Pseudomonas synxantha]